MAISREVEKQIREAFSGAIAKDERRVSAALDGIGPADNSEAVGLAMYACGFVVNDIYRNEATDQDLESLSQHIVTEESQWSGVDDVAKVGRFLKAAAFGDPTFGGLEADEVVTMMIVCGGHLLSYYRLDEQRWYEYLDEIWGALEATAE